jgi:hypothetical protein
MRVIWKVLSDYFRQVMYEHYYQFFLYGERMNSMEAHLELCVAAVYGQIVFNEETARQ